MDFNAKLIQALEPVTGEGKNGPWKKQYYIFETESQYPRQICVMVWGDKPISNPAIMQIGARLNVSFDLESREFNGRWYTDVRAWRIQEATADGGAAAMGAPMGAAPAASPMGAAGNAAAGAGIAAPSFPAPNAGSESPDDLPF